ERFGPNLAALAQDRRVIAVDLQGHGPAADIDRPLRYELMADDVAGLLKQLGVGKADIMGYSLGGGVALQTAIKHPDLVRKLVVASAHVRRDAIYSDMLVQQAQVGADAAEFLKDTPMYQLYQKVAPRPEDFGRLLDKVGAGMAADFDYSEEVR